MANKLCNQCGVEKPLSEFRPTPQGSSPQRSSCRDCDRRAARLHLLKPGVQERMRDNHLQRKFGITQADYDRMLEEQGGVCAICSKAEIYPGRGGAIKRLAVDHDHQTGEVRGLLCQSCNMAIAWLGENPELFVAAMEYLGHALPSRKVGT